MEEMIGKKDEQREKTKEAFLRLNFSVKNQIIKRDDICCCFVNYNKFLLNPKENIKRITNFLKIPNINLDKMVNIVDKKLYRKRR